jgi:putative endonuclease
MFYVYFLRSLKNPSKTYVGYTSNLQQRLETHNSGGSVHTRLYKPWKLVVYVAFNTEEKALAFEKYIKIGSGYAFAKKRFWIE